MSNENRGRVAEIVTGAIHLFALSVVIRVLLFAYAEYQRSDFIGGGAVAANTSSQFGGSGPDIYLVYVLAMVIVTLTVGGAPFALVVLGRNLSGETGRRTETGLAAAFVGVGVLLVVVPVTLPFGARLAGGVALCVLGVALPVAVGHRYYAGG